MSETKEQKALVAYFRLKYPRHHRAIRASQSGGFKGRGKAGAIRMNEIKAMGGVTGESDLAILLPRGNFGSFLMELKATNGKHKTSDEQLEYIEYHNEFGNCACVAKGLDMAILAIDEYMKLPLRINQ